MQIRPITPVNYNYTNQKVQKNNSKSNIAFGMSGKDAVRILQAVAEEAVTTGKKPLEIIQAEAVPGIRKLTEEKAFWSHTSNGWYAHQFDIGKHQGDMPHKTRPRIRTQEENWKESQRALASTIEMNLMPNSKYPFPTERIEQSFDSTIGQYH